MSPAILIGAIIIAALLRNTRTGSGPGRWRFWRVLAWFVLFPVTLFTVSFTFAEPSVVAVLASLACLAVWFGTPIAHRIEAPLGFPRAAHARAAVGAVPFHNDITAHAALASSRACITLRRRSGKAPATHLARIEGQLRKAGMVTGTAVAASGFLAIAGGDPDRGRNLLFSVNGFARKNSSRAARAYAARWLVADAASRGDWPALLLLGETFTTRLTRFTHAVAARFVHATPTDKQLWSLWLRCPARIATWPLLRKALAYKPHEAAKADMPLLARHVAALRDGGTDKELVDLANAWEAQTIPEAARAMVLADLAALGATRPHLAAQHAAFRAVATYDDPLSELEISIQALHRRHDDERELPALEEWGEYVMLRDLYKRAAIDMAHRRLAYQTAHLIIGNHAVHLLNKRGERAMGHAMFVWLLSESTAVGDQGFIAHYTRNSNVSR